MKATLEPTARGFQGRRKHGRGTLRQSGLWCLREEEAHLHGNRSRLQEAEL